MARKFEIAGIQCIAYSKCLRIKKSHAIKCKDAYDFCVQLKKHTGDKYRRSVRSWNRELIAHIVLYKFHLFPSHVDDTDLADDEQFYRKATYVAIFVLYKIAAGIYSAFGGGLN